MLMFRIAQYELAIVFRTKKHFMEMAKILKVNLYPFIGVTLPGCRRDIMLTFLWLDKIPQHELHLFQLVRNPANASAF